MPCVKPVRRRSLTLLGASVIAVCVMSGCSFQPRETRTTDRSDTRYEPPAPRPRDRDIGLTAAELVDRYWNQHYEEYTGEPFPPLDGGIVADPTPTCGSRQLPAGNAYYCPADDSIVYDPEFIQSILDQYGEGAVEATLAHEYGHVLQQRLDPSHRVQRQELLADCIAGATLVGLVDDGVIELDEEDQQAIIALFESLGDEADWSEPSDHGSARQRVDALTLGARQGLTACFQNIT